jgi:crotonobetainyl-CoA:carnitine CoA-transferase CaiB-like acyl-CoA transferase
MFTSIEQADVGELRMPAPPVRFSLTPASVRLPPPRLGEHNDEILSELVDENRHAPHEPAITEGAT